MPDDLTIAEVRSWYDLAQAGEALPFPEEDETSTETASEPRSDDEPENEEEPKKNLLLTKMLRTRTKNF